MAFRVLAHGGALSPQSLVPAVQAACDAAASRHDAGDGLLACAIAAVRHLEDDGRFNAGRGALVKLDGRTREMDAAVMTSDGRFGAVSCIEDVRHPVLAAEIVRRTPHNLLVGQGATALAEAFGLERLAPPRAPTVDDVKVEASVEGKLVGKPVSVRELLDYWNYAHPMPPHLEACDTVGAVATDGSAFAAAASTGGLGITLRGRASDLAVPGGGIWAGPEGCVAVTGNGDILGRLQAARRIHDGMEGGEGPERAIRAVAGMMEPAVGFGAIVLGRDGVQAQHSNRTMPWAMAER